MWPVAPVMRMVCGMALVLVGGGKSTLREIADVRGAVVSAEMFEMYSKAVRSR